MLVYVHMYIDVCMCIYVYIFSIYAKKNPTIWR